MFVGIANKWCVALKFTFQMMAGGGGMVTGEAIRTKRSGSRKRAQRESGNGLKVDLGKPIIIIITDICSPFLLYLTDAQRNGIHPNQRLL